ncbi:MAG: methyltransferase regulatory domain-containing protein, partial [Burkholderiaceae bacterium]
DFNPAQSGFAQELARASKAQCQLYDDAFDQFLNRTDLPDFDFIGLHGIWSWISDQNRTVISEFVAKKLKVGGVLYISYNTLPGWAAFAPMRHLMTEHAEILGAEGRGIVSRIDGAIEFAEKFLATNPLFLRANPLVGERLSKIKDQNRHYLAHEYFNRDWHPMHFAALAQCLAPAKVQYACSANYLDAIDAVNLTAEQQAFLKEIPDPMFEQTVRDFMTNQQFRRDYWVKGARRLSAFEQAQALRDQRVLLTTPRDEVALKVTGALGEASLNEPVYGPVLQALADHQVKTIAQVEKLVADSQVSFGQLLQAVHVLMAAGHIASVQAEATITAASTSSKALNRHIQQKSLGTADLSYLASPVTGGGIVVGRFAQLFISALAVGKNSTADWAQHVWQILSAQGQRIIKEGNTLQSAEEKL